MEENITIVFHGFLNLPHLQKLKLVEAMNIISTRPTASQSESRRRRILPPKFRRAQKDL